MRICLVSETWAPEINGVAHTLGRLSHELLRRDTWLELIRPAPLQGRPFGVPGMQAELHVRRLRLPGYPDVPAGWASPARIRQFWQAQRPDVVYLATQGPLSWSARRAAQQLSIPVVAGWNISVEQYGRDHEMPWLAAFGHHYLRYIHNGCASTLVPTHRQAQSLTAYGVHRVQVLARGIDGERFSPSQRDASLRHAWGVTEHQPVALYAGRLAAEKNLDLLQESLHAMREVRPDMAQVIVGDGPARKQLQRALPNAHFTGFLGHKALARHYASADIFLFPSLSETWGHVVAEAMASGLAVVAYEQAAGAELIDSGINGVTVTPGDDEAFRQAAVTLCRCPADYARYGRLARLRALEQRWSDIATQFLYYLTQAQETYHATPHTCSFRSS